MFSSNARLNSRINHFEERVLAGHYGHRYDPARPTIHAGILGSLWAGLSVFRDRCFAPSAVNQSVTRDRTLKTGELETLTHLSSTLLEKSRIWDSRFTRTISGGHSDYFTGQQSTSTLRGERFPGFFQRHPLQRTR